MYKELKPKLNIDEQISHLIGKGVKFEIDSIDNAKEYLANNNNYFKLRAYRKNFHKNSSDETQPIEIRGKYINLDFAMLKDLAIIDMRMRYIFISMSLDIEHFLKVALLKNIENSGEDGYSIVEDYFDKLEKEQIETTTGRKPYEALMSELARNKGNPYCGNLIDKYQGEYPIWVFIEIIPLGRLTEFFNYCAERLKNKELKEYYYLLKTVKQLRNASAHSNCLINDLSANNSKHSLNLEICRSLSEIGISSNRRKKCKCETLRQIVTLLYLHKKVVTSVGVHNHNCVALNELIERMYRNIDFYMYNDVIISSFDFLKKIVDKWYEIA